ncbi:MAG TPA: ABC transporter substrate-binding protein, partial [Acidimicrobiales bacterium]|nr:ABC transporter substrate-binding protein [Acidimicrobiales bacterium]
VVLKASPDYWGPKPAWSEVVIRNVQASEQGLDVERGQYEVGLDLSPSQTTSLSGVKIVSGASPNIWFLFDNDSRKVAGGITDNHDFQQAVRYGVNYQSLLAVAGKGAIQAAGLVPTQFNGTLPMSDDTHTSVALAKQYLAKSGLKNPTVKLYYASDISLNGISPGTVAAVVQQDLQAVGITVELEPQSITISLNGYREGTEQMGLWFWEPDYPDANDYLAFAPGHLVGLRAGFTAAVSPAIAALANKAAVTTAPAERTAIYQQYQQAMNADGPFVPLIQTAQVLVATKNLSGLAENALWFVDLRNLG